MVLRMRQYSQYRISSLQRAKIAQRIRIYLQAAYRITIQTPTITTQTLLIVLINQPLYNIVNVTNVVVQEIFSLLVPFPLTEMTKKSDVTIVVKNIGLQMSITTENVTTVKELAKFQNREIYL